MGLLGLLLPLYLTTTPELLPLARAVRKVAAGQEQEYPLMVALINLARIAYDILMEGGLKR